MRCSVSDYKTEDRKGETNVMSAEFTINPLNELYNWSYQIYQGLSITSMFPIIGSTITADNIWTLGSSSQNVVINYNKNASLRSGSTAQLYRNGTLLETITTPSNYQLNDNSKKALVTTIALVGLGLLAGAGITLKVRSSRKKKRIRGIEIQK